jgi:RNA polymerase sigma-70 factor (ECF subfamily)
MIEKEELARSIAELVEQLPEAQRDAVILHYWQEIPLKQLAEILDKSPAAVAGLLQRGLATLREQASGKKLS